MNRRRFLGGATVAAAAVGAGVLTVGFRSSAGAEASAAQGAADSTVSYETTTVGRGDLSSEREFNASVSHGDPWTVNTTATGTITAANPIGTLVGFGESLLRIDNKPLTLAKGEMPMYRELYEVDTSGRDQNGDRLIRQTGPDVIQLQSFLLDEGFDANGKLEADGEFGSHTEKAVKAWQDAVGLPVTGRVDSSQLVFATDPLRIDTTSRIGDPFTSLDVTGADPKILVDTSTRDRSALPVGAMVEIDINGVITSGTVSEQKQVTSADGSRLWRTTVTTDAAPAPDATAAKVTVVQTVADDVLYVPVSALLALSEGGFAVEVIDGEATRLVEVEVGDVLEGNAEIDGDVLEGDAVVIPV